MSNAKARGEIAAEVEKQFAETERIDLSVGQVVGLVVSGAVVILAIVVSVLALTSWASSDRLPIAVLAASTTILAVAVSAAIYFTGVDDRNARRRLWQQAEIAGAIGSTGDPETPSLRNLLLLNRQEMTNYHELTKQQARRSFSNSLVAMWLGFLIVATCIVIIAIPGVIDGNTKLTVAALGSVGTVVSGFITRTFLRQRALSIDQLNRFFNQPLVTSYLLTAERIALEQTDDKIRLASLDRVITAALGAANEDNPDLTRTRT
jgi:hypothetical protein